MTSLYHDRADKDGIQLYAQSQVGSLFRCIDDLADNGQFDGTDTIMIGIVSIALFPQVKFLTALSDYTKGGFEQRGKRRSRRGNTVEANARKRISRAIFANCPRHTLEELVSLDLYQLGIAHG